MKAVRFSSKGPKLKKKNIFINNLDDFSIRAWDKTSVESDLGVFWWWGCFCCLLVVGFFCFLLFWRYFTYWDLTILLIYKVLYF